ncbi:MAG: hypothetical protein ACTSX6_06440 [Candidatus Heimdallarchaeaceae archaeon]
MVRGKLIGVGIAFIIGYIFLIYILPSFIPQFSVTKVGTQWGLYLILGFGILVAISAFLPSKSSKVTREVAYLLLFIAIIITVFGLMAPFAHKVEVDTENCANVFFPKSTATSVVYNVVDYASCVLTGYYPKESPETANVAWTSFYVFYLILPFAFILVLIYGLMKSMAIGSWFGDFGGAATKILSFIIALFAARVLMGEVLLEFLGYGAWGLGVIFAGIFIVNGLKHMMESWYKVEEAAATTREMIGKEIELKRKSMENLRKYLNKIKTQIELNMLIRPGQAPRIEIFDHLPEEIQGKIRPIIEDPTLSLEQKKHRIRDVLGGRR